MLSAIIITKNEEDVIADCIDSIKDVATEIIVVDSNSVDRTVEIAKVGGAKIYQNEFKDFSSQRNFALSKASYEWVLYLDADEQATSAFTKEIVDVMRNFEEVEGISGYYINRQTFYLGRDWDFIDKVQRLFYKKYLKKWEGVVHETPIIKGKFGEIKSPIKHFTHRSLEHMLAKTNEWSDYEAELRLKVNHPKMKVIRFARVMLTGFIRSYIFEKGYKNGTEGFIESMYQAFSMFVTYAKLWEKQQAKS